MIYTSLLFFFFNDTATTEIYTLSLHDSLPISACLVAGGRAGGGSALLRRALDGPEGDRKSTRLNSSHLVISYAVFCLKKKNRLRSNFEVIAEVVTCTIRLVNVQMYYLII